MGIAGAVHVWPKALAIGDGAYASLFAQNVVGLAACFGLYGVGVALEAARARGGVVASRYFQPAEVPAEEP